MKLTDAVIKGREQLEPRQGNDLYAPEEGCEKYGGCYRGMAVVGAGAVELPIADEHEEEGFDLTDVLLITWPWLRREHVTYPCTCKVMSVVNDEPYTMTVAHMMAHLWDAHVTHDPTDGPPHIEALDDPWTFERITDWLRSIEPPDVTPAAAPQA